MVPPEKNGNFPKISDSPLRMLKKAELRVYFVYYLYP